MTSIEQLAFEAAIVKACVNHRKAHWRDHDYCACVFIEKDFFIKFGEPQTLWPEIATQSYISKYAESQADTPGIPRIPKIIHHFQDQGQMYIVMEYIKLTDSPPDFSERTSEALRWLATVPAPPDHVIGPLGNGHIRHYFFQDNEAPLRFSSIGALERYIEKARLILPKVAREQVQPVRISHEQVIFTQPDMDDSNFGVDEHGRTVLLDFGGIALLPESFAGYTTSLNNSLTALGWPSSRNEASMAAISSCLWMVSDPKLGLNEDGYPEKYGSKC